MIFFLIFTKWFLFPEPNQSLSTASSESEPKEMESFNVFVLSSLLLPVVNTCLINKFQQQVLLKLTSNK